MQRFVTSPRSTAKWGKNIICTGFRRSPRVSVRLVLCAQFRPSKADSNFTAGKSLSAAKACSGISAYRLNLLSQFIGGVLHRRLRRTLARLDRRLPLSPLTIRTTKPFRRIAIGQGCEVGTMTRLQGWMERQNNACDASCEWNKNAGCERCWCTDARQREKKEMQGERRLTGTWKDVVYEKGRLHL